MTKLLLFRAPDCSTLANFINWAGNTVANSNAPGTWQGISFALTTFGWTRTADTGQVDWDTISTVPTGGSTVYEIWESTDSFSSQQIFLKLEYAANSSDATVPTVFYNVGTGTDGAGNINGTNTGRQQIATADPGTFTGQATYTMSCYFSGDAGRFHMMIFLDPQNTHINHGKFFSVERSVDNTGAYTNTYMTILGAGYVSNVRQQHIFFSGSSTTAEVSSWMTVLPNTPNNSNNNVTGTGKYGCAVCPVFPMVGVFDYPGLAVAIGYFTDFVNCAPTTLTVYGASHNYVAGVTNTLILYNTSFGGHAAVLMRFE